MDSDNIIELETEIEELEPKTAPSGTDIVLPPLIVGHGHGKGK